MVINVDFGFITINQQDLYYSKVGRGEPVIVLLGWSSNLDTFPYEKVFLPHIEQLNKYQFIFIHLSNFSKSCISDRPYYLEDYSEELCAVTKHLNISKYHLIGHSAGGRISLFHAFYNSEEVNKLVLLNSAGLKHKRVSEKIISETKRHFARCGYVSKRDDEILRLTFSNLYHTDLTEKLANIHTSALVIWGAKDETINLKKAFTFVKHLPQSKLIVYSKMGHETVQEPKVYYDIFNFLNHEKLNN
jgi:pimeloyl-ACP methyl ester carboxylesterase